VNVSTVHGELPELIRKRFGVTQGWFYACGISLVMHPHSPMVPTVHANFRFFELYEKQDGDPVDAWFGGGADLTPYYLFEEDARHFHQVYKTVCDRFHPELYPQFKTACDRYFHNAHRGEARGVGRHFLRLPAGRGRAEPGVLARNGHGVRGCVFVVVPAGGRAAAR
jgi:coproporphyrinogen III oxidase